MKIPKYLWGNSIEEWGSQWKDRLLPSARSRVLQKWNASGKRPKPESSNEYTKRRIKEETKRTWRSDAADIAHGIGEGVLALHPYTAIPYYGAKVGQDVINGNVNLNTALNASIPLFHLSPQAVGLKEATNVALEDAANAGSKTARNWRVAREINLATKNKPNLSNRTISVKRSTNEITGQPDLVYTLYNEFGEPIGLTNIGGAVFGSGNKTHRMVDGVMSMRNAHKVSEDTYNAAIQDIIDNGGKGLESGWSLMMPLKTLAVTSKFPHTVIGLEFGNPVRLLTGTSKRSIPQKVLGNHYLELKPSFEIKYNESTGNFEKIPIINLEPYVSTSLKFFERKPARISEAERAGVPKGERNNINNSGNLEKTVNNIILENRHWLPKETGRFAQKHSSIGSSYRKQYEKLWGKENTDRLTDDLLGKLVLIRNHLIETNIPLKGDFVYVVDGQAQAYRNGQEIGYLSNSYIDNGRALHPEMVKKQGINNAGVSELLYNGTILAENRPIISGSKLLMPEVTTHVWNKYPTRKLISMEGVHAWPLRTAQERGIKLNYEKNWHTLPEFSKLHQLAINENIRTNLTGLPIYKLSEPSYLPMVKNARIFDISLLRDGYINLDFTPGFAYKQGGKMNTLLFLKNGSGIHIKKKNRGSFTRWCGGNVTEECIRRGKASSNPKIRKKATFADNARHFKHKEGGKAFVEGVNVLDSNPKAYKYVKKKYKMRMALDGTKFDWTSTLANVGSSILQGYFLNEKVSREAKAAKAMNKLTSKDFFDIYNLKLQEAKLLEEQLAKAVEAMTGTTINSSNIVAANNAWKNASGEYAALKNNVDLQNRAIDAEAQALKSNIWGNAISGAMLQGMGLLNNYLNNKSSNATTPTTISTKTSYNYFSAPKKFGTFNNDGSMNLGYNMTWSTDKGILTKNWSDGIFNKSYTDYLK